MPWILLAMAFALVGTLYALSRRGASGAADTVELIRAESIPGWMPGPGWASAVPPRRAPGEAIRIPIYPPWTEAAAKVIFVPSVYEVFDAYCGKLWKPNLKFRMAFPEHPAGGIDFVLNSRSMREDDEPLPTRPALRVLVAGDSHTDGVCANEESFANLTEVALELLAHAESEANGLRFDPQSIEVLNAGKGSHSFFNYLGVLERNLDLKPDLFVVAVYGGNDFDEVLTAWHHFFNRGARPPGIDKYPDEFLRALRLSKAAMSQALSSIKYFDVNPDQFAIAVQAATDVCEQIQTLCRERGIRLFMVYLPARCDVEPTNPDLNLDALMRELKLTPAALKHTDKLADAWLERLATLGVETLDMRPAFRRADHSVYWNTDWHINLAGHQHVARALVKALAQR